MTKRFDVRPSIEHNWSSAEDVEAAGSTRRAIELWQRLERMVADHPKQSLIAALTAGALLGWITKRR
jgi:hypothetical protein